jgi:uncharacterized protein (TIGR03067 family)
MRNIIICLLFTGAVAGATLPAMLRSDKSLLQGNWTVVAAEEAGQRVDQLDGSSYTFDGDKLRIRSPFFEMDGQAYKLNTFKNPKEIDIQIGQGRVIRGIYRLQGDDLVLCTAPFRPTTNAQGHNVVEPGPRPTAFDSRLGSLTTLHRAPAAAAAPNK